MIDDLDEYLESLCTFLYQSLVTWKSSHLQDFYIGVPDFVEPATKISR